MPKTHALSGLFISGALALALAGCASSPVEEPANQAPASLTIWVDSELAVVAGTVAEQVESNSGDTLTIVEKEFAAIETELAAGAPAPDLFVGSSEWTDRLAAAGLISSLGESELEGFGSSIASATSYQGQVYGIPYSTESLALVCNGEKVDSQPSDFNELDGLSVRLNLSAGGDPYSVFPVQSSFGVLPLTLDENGDWQEQTGFASERGAEFATWLRNNKGLFRETDYATAINSFVAGKEPCLLTGPWSVPELERRAQFEIRVFDTPSAGGEPALSFATSRAIFVSAMGSNVEAAKRVAQHFAAEPTQKLIYAQTGRVPAMTKLEPWVEDPIVKGFMRASSNTVVLPSGPLMQQSWGPWTSTLNKLTSSDEDPALIWSQLVTELSKANGN